VRSYEDLLTDFDNNLIDILILPEDDLPLSGEKEFFTEEKCTLVIPKGNKNFNFGKKLTLEKLEELPVVLFESDDHLFFKWCRAKLKGLPKKLNIKFTVNSHGHMLHAVHEGLGMAIVPNHVLNRSYFKDKVVALPEYEILSGKLYIVYQKESQNHARIKNTIHRLLSHRDTFKI
jgi:DNA-binding transcriptional LysR family regulator